MCALCCTLDTEANPSAPAVLENLYNSRQFAIRNLLLRLGKSKFILKHSAALLIVLSLQRRLELKYLIFFSHSRFAEMAHFVIMVLTLIPFPHTM